MPEVDPCRRSKPSKSPSWLVLFGLDLPQKCAPSLARRKHLLSRFLITAPNNSSNT